MEEQRGIVEKGGTMRLGAYPCVLKNGSLAARLYGHKERKERKAFADSASFAAKKSPDSSSAARAVPRRDEGRQGS